ncbi:DUF445 domain-containing protein [Pseudobacteroides cellulosolvens]|uniref:DUF445 domain-containing protein n=1 Tax=Pseudobacteroides cellulosolvens ATCC 35603 = DSM 2933 TaxID=398512 RepID=A0A0L6JSS8_9FIRM|nr:DUF445 family protein [Pseudobacteroides cellulosolvens]KNY28901.1 protein of unknown function DUF445 [Pseudobacteroides cellulosolvens ATCC 35603 = DSM 2933]
MNVVQVLSGPVIGAVIGYFTNYIAVKMLFRPLNPVKVGNFTLPFTPGVIPRRKKELAGALGTTISNMLITQEDLKNALLSDGMKQSITNGIVEYVKNKTDAAMTIKDTLNCYVNEKDYEIIKVHLQELLSERMAAGLSGIDLGAIITSEAGAAVKGKLQGTMFAMMINDSLIASLAQPIGEKVKEYIQNHGVEIIQPVIGQEIENLENETVNSILNNISFNENKIKEFVGRIYTECIDRSSDAIIKQIDIVGIVRNKIQDMDVIELEKLVLSVMKNELDSVINLGAGLGFIIGLLNLIF